MAWSNNWRATGAWPREASAFDDGRLNFIELGIVGCLERQPSRRASIEKLWIIGGGMDREGPSLQRIRNSCKMLANLGYARLSDGMIELAE